MMTFDEEYTLKYQIGAEKRASTTFSGWETTSFPGTTPFKHSFFVWEVLAAIAA